jgi:hypothetical protein
MNMNDYFSEIQELFGLFYFQGLSDDLYDNDTYFSLCISLFLVTFFWIFSFYYILKSPKWGTMMKWIIWILIGCVINFFISYFISYNSIADIYLNQNLEIPYSNEFIGIGLSNFISSLVISIVFSFLLKWKSVNCSKIPF